MKNKYNLEGLGNFTFARSHDHEKLLLRADSGEDVELPRHDFENARRNALFHPVNHYQHIEPFGPYDN